ncbi:class I adenylate-forming enzyme family protein [Actinomadura livida]|uniref:AMP-binding protein n=1 Tax=Actinomadura livida TaxID=79909 RepID=A0A7W7MY95_9ACTN|nr:MULTISPECIES: class I adenylate-forming enzyme family protein [Actinomadura]MBB4774739.1 acyl-coenzyme A synthetase/AMP-(fatty) acid ligase [Actinomadura catellatispora]GGU06301.1 putative fatty-acid-CoA ligase FadD [Actinomadura livida]
MKRSIAYRSVQKRGLHIGLLPEMAAAVNASTPIDLDHDLDVLPGAGRRMTVTDFADHIRDLAARLWAAGVRPDEHVVLYKTANADAWMLGAATSRIGAIPVMLSPSLDAITVGALLKRLGRPSLLTDGRTLDALAELPLADLVERTLIVRGDRPGALSLADYAGAPDVAPRVRPIDAAAVITHTSGTTGVPKLVVHTPRTQAVRLRPQWRLLSLMRRRETVAIHIPFVHSRMVAAMSLALLQEMPVLLMREGSLDRVAEAFREHRPGFVEALPNSLMEWEALTDDPRRPFSSVRYFSSTFDAIHPRTMSRLLRSSARRGALYFQIYGQSEVGPAVGRAYFRHSAHRTNGRCVGWAMPQGCAKIRLVSRDGRPVSEQNPGYIEVAWSGLAKTYFAEQDRYDENRFGDWWRTGDVGYRTRLGCLHMLDREVDMIGGVQSSLEVEDQVLGRLEELSELVVVHGLKSEPIPVVCTTDDAPLDRDRWRAAVAGFPQLADPIQIPRAELPRTGTLKVQRLALSRRLKEEMKDRA